MRQSQAIPDQTTPEISFDGRLSRGVLTSVRPSPASLPSWHIATVSLVGPVPSRPPTPDPNLPSRTGTNRHANTHKVVLFDRTDSIRIDSADEGSDQSADNDIWDQKWFTGSLQRRRKALIVSAERPNLLLSFSPSRGGPAVHISV